MPLDPESEEATVENMMRENDEFIAKLSATEVRTRPNRHVKPRGPEP